jgi:hypothetical protein
VDHGSVGGLADDDHAIYLLADGTRNLTGNLATSAGVTVDGRDLSVDGTKLDGIEALADVTDAINVAAAGAAMSGGAFHDGFSDFVAAEHVSLPNTIANVLSDHDLAAHTGLGLFDASSDVDHDATTNFVANEHIDHSGVTLTAGSGLAGGGDISVSRTFDLDINSLAAAAIAAGDFVPFWDITATATNKKITFANLEAALTHDSLIAGTIASHDTTATGANLTTLTDNSIANALHRHSELVASDGSPDPALSVDADGKVYVVEELGIGRAPTFEYQLQMYRDNALTSPQLRMENDGTGDACCQFVITGIAGWIFGIDNSDSDKFKLSIDSSDIGSQTAFTVDRNLQMGINASAPDARFEVATETDEGKQAITIDQNDADQAFIDFQGTSAASAANNISTLTSGNSIQGFLRQEVNGATVWTPYYDAPTS